MEVDDEKHLYEKNGELSSSMKKKTSTMIGIKRLMREAKELSRPSYYISAIPINDDLYLWHFTIRGAKDSAFEDGIYHGEIRIHPQYPFKPPQIRIFTPNGRFKIGEAICISTSNFHPEMWQPSWGIRTIITALIGFMPSPSDNAIGSVELSEFERRQLAKESQKWKCNYCNIKNSEILLSNESLLNEKNNNQLLAYESSIDEYENNKQSNDSNNSNEKQLISNSKNVTVSMLSEKIDCLLWRYLLDDSIIISNDLINKLNQTDNDNTFTYVYPSGFVSFDRILHMSGVSKAKYDEIMPYKQNYTSMFLRNTYTTLCERNNYTNTSLSSVCVIVRYSRILHAVFRLILSVGMMLFILLILMPLVRH